MFLLSLNRLAPRRRVLLHKLAVAHLVKKFPIFYATDNWLPCLQKPV